MNKLPSQSSDIWTQEWKRTYPRLQKDEPYITIEGIPQGAASVNLRTRLSKEEWDKIRRMVYKRAGYQCELCGGVGSTYPVECHEIWDWQIARAIPRQKLIDCRALCPTCHQAKHIGRTIKVKNQVEYMKVKRHIMKWNRWRADQFEDYFYKISVTYSVLNGVNKWRLDILWARRLLNDGNVDI